MVRYCTVSSCIHNRGCHDKSISFFKEPFDAQLAAKWKIALWGENERRHTFKICQLHFAENDLIRSVNGIRLKLGAVPCLLIDSVASDVDSRGRVEFECYDYDNKIDDNVDCMQVESVFVEAEPMHESKSSETSNFCFRCAQQNVQYQKNLQKLSDKCDRQETIILKQRSELRMLRRWAQLRKLTPPSRLATASPTNEQRQSIDPNYEYCVETEPERGVEEQKEEKAIDIDDMATDENTSESIVDIVEIKEEVKKEEDDPIDVAQIATKSSEAQISPSFECGECDKKFKVAVSLKRHVSMMHRNSKAIPLVSPSAPQPRKPRPQIDQIVCYICNGRFEHMQFARDHMRKMHKISRVKPPTPSPQIKQIECFLCKRRFKNWTWLRGHMKKMHTISQFTIRPKRCRICDETFAANQNHSCAGLKLDCEYCSVQFDSLHRLNAHLDSDHINHLFYVCNICNRSFRMRSFMEHHKSKHSPGCFACTECPEKFDNKQQRRRHRLDAHSKRTHLCDECGKSFQWERHLATHKMTHGEKEQRCTKCPYTAHLPQSLRAHMLRNHSDSTSIYSCNVCSKLFAKHASLLKHNAVHTRTEADRTHACDICPSKFFNSKNLRSHVRAIHRRSGRSFNCTYCDKAYKHSGDLTKHLRSHLGDKMYKCPDCPEAFRLPFELKKHSYTHYREKDGVDRMDSESATSNPQ